MQLEICNVSAFTFSYVYVNYVWGWNSYIYLSINTYTMKQLENIFVSLMASSKNYLGNHSKFPLCLVENWFKSLWKVPLDLATYISRTETDLMRFVHWVLRHLWVSCTLCPDTWLIYHMCTVPFAARGHEMCGLAVPIQIVLCLKMTHYKRCSQLQEYVLLTSCEYVSSHFRSEMACSKSKQNLWLHFAVSSFPLLLLSYPS